MGKRRVPRGPMGNVDFTKGIYSRTHTILCNVLLAVCATSRKLQDIFIVDFDVVDQQLITYSACIRQVLERSGMP
jgi:hypothetical protein